MDKLLPPTRRNLLGRVTQRQPAAGTADTPPASSSELDCESDLTWAELSDKLNRERLEHERLRQQDAGVIRDLRLSEDLTVQLLDLRAQSFNGERRRLVDELNSV